MEMTEERIYEALGVQQEAQTQADADAAAESEDGTTYVVSDAPEAESESASGSRNAGNTDGATQSSDERHANAARRREQEAQRRQQEQQTAIDQAVERALQAEREKHAKEMDSIFEQAGLTDSYAKTPIKNKADFDAWHTRHEDAKLQSALKKGQLTQETLNEMIERNPTVQAAKQQEAQRAEAARAAQEAADRAKIESELAEIRKMDPSIKSVTDFVNMPHAKEFYTNVQRGMSFLEAYRLATWDDQRTATMEAARNQARTNARGKDHLGSIPAARGTGAASVPHDVEAMYRVFNPKATAEEISRHYNSIK